MLWCSLNQTKKVTDTVDKRKGTAMTITHNYLDTLAHEMAHLKVYQQVNAWRGMPSEMDVSIELIYRKYIDRFDGKFHHYASSVRGTYEYKGQTLYNEDLVILAGVYHDIVLKEHTGNDNIKDVESWTGWEYSTKGRVMDLLCLIMDLAIEGSTDARKFLDAIGWDYEDFDEAIFDELDYDNLAALFECVSELVNNDTPYWSVPIRFYDY